MKNSKGIFDEIHKFQLVYAPIPSQDELVFGGCVRYSEKQSCYQIIINNQLSKDEQQFALKHELSHILLKHTGKPFDPVKEKQADDLANIMTDSDLNHLLGFADYIKYYPAEIERMHFYSEAG